MSIPSTGSAHDPGLPGRIAYSVAEAAQAIGSSRSAIYVALKEKRLNAKKIGARTVIEDVELRRYVASLPTMGEAE
jgi:hypothetical protein